MLTTYSVLKMKWLEIYAKRLPVKSKCNRLGVLASWSVHWLHSNNVEEIYLVSKAVDFALCRIWCVCVARLFSHDVHCIQMARPTEPQTPIPPDRNDRRVIIGVTKRVFDRDKKIRCCAWGIVMQHALTAVMHQIRSPAFISQWCL